MITAQQLYGKSDISKGQRHKLGVANFTANHMFNNKSKFELGEEVTLQDIENIIINKIRYKNK